MFLVCLWPASRTCLQPKGRSSASVGSAGRHSCGEQARKSCNLLGPHSSDVDHPPTRGPTMGSEYDLVGGRNGISRWQEQESYLDVDYLLRAPPAKQGISSGRTALKWERGIVCVRLCCKMGGPLCIFPRCCGVPVVSLQHPPSNPPTPRKSGSVVALRRHSPRHRWPRTLPRSPPPPPPPPPPAPGWPARPAGCAAPGPPSPAQDLVSCNMCCPCTGTAAHLSLVLFFLKGMCRWTQAGG